MPTCDYCGAEFSNWDLWAGHVGICDENPRADVNRAREQVIDQLLSALESDRIGYDAWNDAINELDAISDQHRRGSHSDESAIEEFQDVASRYLG